MPSSKIAFTSCARYQKNQPQIGWNAIEAADPDYLLLLGDQIYMDFGLWPFSREYQGKPKQYTVEQFATLMRQKYRQQWSEPNFSRLVARMRAKNGFFGIWDDHDFAWNNAYGNDPTLAAGVHLAEKRDIARNLFHEFMACAPQPPEIYGFHDTELARLIFLDNRYHATPLGVLHPALMGQQQMAFLARHLQHDRQYTLICGGLTLLHSAENWSKYTQEFAQFKQLIAGVARVLYLGGDIHKNAFGAPSADGRPPCYEIISSGLCVNYLGLPFEFDRRRNWTLLELDRHAVQVHQHDKSGITRYRIDQASWQCEALGRERRAA
ncbi:MAG: alkaline phosphatase D family protein [Rhodoferax sp.]|jgi:alkaline phosphatase D|nr:alkaline phosphatase family protein [Rhodoferax sp.]